MLRISVYPDDLRNWNKIAVGQKIAALGKRIQIEPELWDWTDTSLHWKFDFPGMRIFAVAQDIQQSGVDRGQTVAELQDDGYVRLSPCNFVFNSMSIDFDGSVMPCCNLIGNLDKHRRFIIDTLEPGKSLVDIYFSPAYAAWRRALVRVGPKRNPCVCATCKHKIIYDPAELERIGAKIDARLRELGVAP